MSVVSPQDARRGVLAAAVCYFIWGLFPLYWKQLAPVAATELIAQRHVWALVVLLILIAAMGRFRELGASLRSRSALQWHALSGSILTVNWLIFIWAVNHGHVLETSLGYFLVPLVNVALGRFVLHEQLRRAQWAAIVLAVIGVLMLLVGLGHLPWIALSLAATFGLYGLLRKQSPLGPMMGLSVETLLLAPLAVGYLAWRQATGVGALGHVSLGLHIWIVSVGFVTAGPLMLFAFAARRIRLSTLGLLQYIAPTVQFALGVGLYHEAFPPERAAAFAFIWCGLALYTADNLWTQQRLSRV